MGRGVPGGVPEAGAFVDAEEEPEPPEPFASAPTPTVGHKAWGGIDV